ncbi:uncharacterized protein TrAtP1_006178 [Trichoderma atroviride]|uniref:uncharacterized protein n=1 Tax=Hypocrea atroviridis TaxID=63577 RepID=UPI003319E79C|nr:hypothetical protein TrAtP1_006178 [Trichoderma atroviride]
MPIIRLLHGGCYWQRWLSLQENITTTTSLLSLAVEQGLNTWVDCIMECDSLRPPVKKINAALFSAILRRQAQSIRILVVHDAQLVGKKNLRKALSKKKVRQTFLAALEESHAGDKTNETILSAVVPDYLSILYQALGTGDFELVQDFLNFDVSVKHKLCDGIHNFIKEKYCEKEHLSAALKLFADSGANINERNASGESLVHIAVKSLDADLLHALIDAGADVNATGPSNWTSLHYICHGYGREGFIQHLVRAGANINAKDIAGQTPLHCSVHKNWSTKLVEELIANGASVDIQDTDHRTPIDILLEELGREGPYYKAIYQINALMSAGAHFDVTHRDSCGRTLLYKAILSSDKELTELLVKRGADINEKDEEGRTALHIAVALATDNELISAFWKPPDKSRIVAHLWLRKNLCGVLLGLGADASAKTTNGLTVLHIAADAGIYRLIERLVALGVGLDERDHLGRTPLYLAAAQGYKYAVRTLLKSGANARIRDQAGISPLRRASKGTHATSNSTARILCAHLQGDDLLSECSCEYGKLHISDS